jgi:hypothetical protein
VLFVGPFFKATIWFTLCLVNRSRPTPNVPSIDDLKSITSSISSSLICSIDSRMEFDVRLDVLVGYLVRRDLHLEIDVRLEIQMDFYCDIFGSTNFSIGILVRLDILF